MSTSYVCFSFSVDVQPTVDLQAVSGGQEESGEGEDDSVGNLPCESRRLTVAYHMERYCCLLFFVAPSCGESEDVKLGEGVSEGVRLGEGEGVTAQDEPMDVTSQTRRTAGKRMEKCEEGERARVEKCEEGERARVEKCEEGERGRVEKCGEGESGEVWGGREWRSEEGERERVEKCEEGERERVKCGEGESGEV